MTFSANRSSPRNWPPAAARSAPLDPAWTGAPPGSGRLSIDGADIELTHREWLLLECLVRRVGQVVPKERVQQALTNPEHEISTNAIDVQVSRLRAKLGEAVVIRSLRGLGYRLEEAKAS